MLENEGVSLISRKYHQLVFAFFMSLVISIFNVGLVSNIISIWLKAWAFAFVIAFPTIILVSPIVQKFVSLVLYEDDSGSQ